MTFVVLILNSRIYVRLPYTHNHCLLLISVFGVSVRSSMCERTYMRVKCDRQWWWWWRWLVNGKSKHVSPLNYNSNVAIGIAFARVIRIIAISNWLKGSRNFLRWGIPKRNYLLSTAQQSGDYYSHFQQMIECKFERSRIFRCLHCPVEYLFLSSDEPDIFGSTFFFLRSGNLVRLS